MNMKERMKVASEQGKVKVDTTTRLEFDFQKVRELNPNMHIPNLEYHMQKIMQQLAKNQNQILKWIGEVELRRHVHNKMDPEYKKWETLVANFL